MRILIRFGRSWGHGLSRRTCPMDKLRSDLEESVDDVSGSPTVCGKNIVSPVAVCQLSPVKAYLQIACCFCIICFGNLPFYTLSPLQSSLTGALGLVSIGLYSFMWVVGSFLVQTIVAALGLKLAVVSSAWLSLTFILGYYYPSWPTLLITAVISGLSLGPLVSVPAIYTNIIACNLAKLKGKDMKHYVGPFQGLVSSGLFVGAVLGNSASSAIIFIDEHLASTAQNITFRLNWVNESQMHLHNSLTTFNNKSDVGACTLESTASEVSSSAFYVLLGVATISSIASGISTLFLAKLPGFSCACISPKELLSNLKRSLLETAKILTVPQYILCMFLAGHTGMDLAFFSGFCTKYLVTDCIGIAMVGVITAVYSLCYAISMFVSGKFVVYTSRTIWSFILLLLTIVLYLFLLTWERQQSYAAIVLLAIGMGVESGSWTSVALTYLGVVANEEPEKVFGLFWSVRALGVSIVFFTSSATDSVTVGGSIVLVSLMVACSLYFVAETRYGEKLLTCTNVSTYISKFKYIQSCRRITCPQRGEYRVFDS